MSQRWQRSDPDGRQNSRRRTPNRAVNPKERNPRVARNDDWDSEISALVSNWRLPWIGKKSDQLCMKYVSGDDPWEFYLRYENVSGPLSRIERTIKNCYAVGRLEKCTLVMGNLVACVLENQNRREYFRGVILRYNPKARAGIRSVVVYKLDYGTTANLFPEDVFGLPRDLVRLPCQAMKCRMLDDDHHLKEKFCEELKTAFKGVLQNSVLAVDFKNTDGRRPPSFSVELWASGSDKRDVNLNLWLEGRVMPKLKNIPPDEPDVFHHLSELDVDPFYEDAVGGHLSSRGARPATAAGETEQTAVLNELADKLVPFNFKEQSSDTVGKSVETSADLKPAQAVDSSPAAPKCKTKEFIPPGLVVVINGSDDVVTDLQEDYRYESRICQFYKKHRYCGRINCDKEHVEESPHWTTEVVPMYDALFNDLCLPDEGSTVLVKVQHLKGPTSFYVNLPDAFSDIGEPGGVLETSATLHADLNTLESNHPLLPCGPLESELVVALGQQEALGPKRKWLRARVMEYVSETLVEVFFLDFGNREIVSIQNLRAPRPQFLHLPAQAVLTRFHKLVPHPGKKEAALNLLKTLILNKELKATVVSEYDRELDVLLYLDDGRCVNEILVQQQLAYEF